MRLLWVALAVAVVAAVALWVNATPTVPTVPTAPPVGADVSVDNASEAQRTLQELREALAS